MRHVGIVGAGISGLATAWFLHKRGHAVTVLESGIDVGGSIRTVMKDGYLIDTGPTSTLFRNGALGELVNELDMRAELVTADRSSSRRYIVKNHQLVELPTGPVGFLTTPLFSARGKLRMLREPLHFRASQEESVSQFVRRRLGPEFLDWGIDPFVSGVYAGDPERLSVRAATAKVYALEAEYGSLFVGAAARWIRGRASGPAPTGKLVSFLSGMRSLPAAIASALRGTILLNTPARAIAQIPGGGWIVQTDLSELRCDSLVLAVPAYQAAALIAPLDEEQAALLRDIAYAPVATVALGFARNQISHPLDGFGLLIPRRVGLSTLGALFSSTLFPGRAPAGQVLLTAFIGGARNPDILAQDEQTIVSQVISDLRLLLGIHGDPSVTNLTYWPKAIPQYNLGHLKRIRRIDEMVLRFPGIHFRANWRDGISVSDCISNGYALASRV